MGGGLSRMAKQELLATIRGPLPRVLQEGQEPDSRDEFIAVTGHHRKHGIRLLGHTRQR